MAASLLETTSWDVISSHPSFGVRHSAADTELGSHVERRPQSFVRRAAHGGVPVRDSGIDGFIFQLSG